MSDNSIWKKSAFVFLVCTGFYFESHSQVTSFYFKQLTNVNGLSDNMIRTITQDKYGFMWIGTNYGLNRFDGVNIKTFFNKQGDSNSLHNNYIQSLYCDKDNNLWIGTYKGLSRYDYTGNRFINYKMPKEMPVNGIMHDKKGRIWLATGEGLWMTDEKTKSVKKYLHNDPEFQKKFQCFFYQVIEGPDGNWYMASNNGIKIFNPLTGWYSEISNEPGQTFSISSNAIYSIAFDRLGFLWANCVLPKSILNKIDLRNRTVKLYDHFIDPQKKWGNNTLQKILIDKRGRIWVTSSYSGMSLYNETTDDFHDYKADLVISGGLLANTISAIYQSDDGTIWAGTGGYGLSYFNPDNNLFSSIYPAFKEDGTGAYTWCRAACEDKQNVLWLATGKGIAKYDRSSESFTIIANEEGKKPALHVNSIRSLLLDNEGDMWIGTAKGLNRYRSATGQIDFFDEKQGILRSFFWMLAKDKNGTVWTGSANGLFRYIRSENRFDDLRKEPGLSKYAYHNVQALFADSHNRLWIGILDVGLVIYDIDKKQQRLLTVKDSMIRDTRFSSFGEDKDGLIWIGSEDGLTVHDPAKNISRFFTKEDGLPSNRANNIMVDSLNRIWIGTSNGLCLLNADRKQIKRFDVNDGLLTNQFNEQSAYRTHDGLFIYPAYKGFLVFRPEAYRESTSAIPSYIISFKVAGKEWDSPVNIESQQKVNLKYNQNFFSIELAGLNYMSPHQCRYAFKLEPFNKDWIYSSKREINYTNVPAGDYTFRYKVITDNADKNAVEKTMGIHINEIFYKTWWFKTSILLIIAGAIIAFYRYRLSQREKILVLQNKAQLLEKEKTLVQYESLKQHLNPHFLFNSLTSLRSLIKTDAKTAASFLDGMSKVYRYVLKSGDEELVLLKDELDFVRTFAELQKTRFNNGLHVNIHVNGEYNNKYIAPVTLQSLIENAIKHNTADTESPLVIDIFTENGFVVVRNNLQRYRIVETSNRKGLAGLQSLYRYYSDMPMEITDDGKYFTVKIPLL